MTRARIRLIVTAVLFLGWISWLGYAVLQRGQTAVISRAQLTGATHLVVADVEMTSEGLPDTRAKVVEVLRGDGVKAGDSIEVLNLPAARPPGAGETPKSGPFLLALVSDGKTYRVAALPESPGYPATSYSPSDRPPIYRWSEETRSQLRGLGLIP